MALTIVGLIVLAVLAAVGIGVGISGLGTGSGGTSSNGQPGQGGLATDGVDFVALRGTATVDGSNGEWPPSNATASSRAVVAGTSTGVFGNWWVMWDDNALYLLVQVQDPVFTQTHEQEPSAMWNGDGVSLELGRDAGGRDPAQLARDGDAHVIFGLSQTGVVVNCVNRSSGGGFPAGRPDPAIRAVAAAIAGGYGIEAAIPWSSTNVRPGQGTVVSVNFDVSDADPGTGQLAAMMSSNPNRSADHQAHPGTWQRMVLG